MRYFTLALALLLFTACSKEAKVNEAIEGSWTLTLFEDQPIPVGRTSTMRFTKTKKDKGTFNLYSAEPGWSNEAQGEYELFDVTQLVLRFDNGAVDVLRILDYGGDFLRMKNTNTDKHLEATRN